MSNQYKKLSFQYSYLQLEFEDVEKICADAALELEEEYRKKYGNVQPEKSKTKKNPKNTNTELEEDADIQTNKNKNSDLKKLYRKIATIAHPDKSTNEEHNEIFKDAAKAYQEDNLAKLLEIASVLNLEIIDLSNESLTLVKNNISSLNKKIDIMKQNSSWAWSRAKNENEKQAILDFVHNFRQGEKNECKS